MSDIADIAVFRRLLWSGSTYFITIRKRTLELAGLLDTDVWMTLMPFRQRQHHHQMVTIRKRIGKGTIHRSVKINVYLSVAEKLGFPSYVWVLLSRRRYEVLTPFIADIRKVYQNGMISFSSKYYRFLGDGKKLYIEVRKVSGEEMYSGVTEPVIRRRTCYCYIPVPPGEYYVVIRPV